MGRRAVVIAMAGAGIAVIGLAVIFLRKPPPPVALLKIVDAAGKPIAGAIVTPDGLRAKKDGSHYGWGERDGVKPLPVTSDADGIAAVRYPFHVEERLETSEISFAVEHPEYCPDRPFAVVDPTPPGNARFKEKVKYWWTRVVTKQLIARPAPVVLKRGAVVEVSADSAEIDDVYPQLTPGMGPRAKFWQDDGKGVFVSKRVAPGTNWLRMIGFPTDGRVHFSDHVEFVASASQTSRYRLPLKSGLRLAGRLDESVPRPVTNGRVLTRTSTPKIGSGALNWSAWRPVNPDGTFVFEALPAGDVEMIVLCDGYVSKNDPANTSAGSRRTPQIFTLVDQDRDVVVSMERTATCEILISDDMGRPLENAKVSFWPNVLWGGRGSTVFATYPLNSEDSFRQRSPPDWGKAAKMEERLYTATSDKQGVAVVTNLPAYGKQQSFAVEHAEFEMPVDRSGRGAGHRYGIIYTGAGETNRGSVQLQKKGKEFIEHPR